jgi:NAD-dependent dihydropyrimidine dehydrogenase PreA subunit
MSFSKIPGRIFWGFLGITALAQPVCAAICPRGRGLCPYPGKCFLYVDADSNSLCDYTRTAISTPSPTATTVAHTPAIPSVTVTSVQPTATPVIHTPAIPSVTVTPIQPVATTAVQTSPIPSVSVTPIDPGIVSAGHTSALQPVTDITSSSSLITAPSGTGIFELVGAHPLLSGILLFLGITALLIWIYRHDIAGIKFHSFSGLLAFSALTGIGISEIIVYMSMGEMASGTLFSLIYMISATALTVYLWMSGNISRTISRCILVLSVISGFVFLAPLMPMEFTGMIHLALSTQALTPGILGILFVLILAFIAGRTFCAHICPVGSAQELTSELSQKKIGNSHYRTFEIIRAGIFIVTVIAGFYYINLMEYTGIYDFFSLTLTAGFFLFAALLVLSVVIYRPVCRILCPFGVLFSAAAHFSRNGLKRTPACIHCKKCEKICPAHCAEEGASKRECYLCGRCTETCPVKGALVYKKR